jgi:hypothetical protein
VCQEARRAGLDAPDQPVAIELQLVQPIDAGRRAVDKGGELGRDEIEKWVGGRLAPGGGQDQRLFSFSAAMFSLARSLPMRWISLRASPAETPCLRAK